jgi:GTP-binding protein
MHPKNVTFEVSSPDLKSCPKPTLPEYAFIGRSNVGKSSLINMLANHHNLAKTSSRPGKTQLINHFNVDAKWFLVDLPGFGYARVSKTSRDRFQSSISNYLSKRDSLINTYVLIDSRLEPQKIDLEFIEWLGEEGIAFSIIFTKIDKISRNQLQRNIAQYKKKLLEQWDELPEMFTSSAELKQGRDEILAHINQLNETVAPLMLEALERAARAKAAADKQIEHPEL